MVFRTQACARHAPDTNRLGSGGGQLVKETLGVQGHVSPRNSEENKSRSRGTQGHFKEPVWREDMELGFIDNEGIK